MRTVQRVAAAAFVVAMCTTGCGPGSTSNAPGAPTRTADRPTPGCGSKSWQDVLEKHATAYGSRADVMKVLPLAFHGKGLIGGATAAAWRLAVGPTQTREELAFGDVTFAGGLDETGPWESGMTGSLVRYRPEEAPVVRLDAFVLRREYLEPARARAVTARCVPATAGPELELDLDDAALGMPRLVFDTTSGALLRYAGTAADGRRTTVTLSRWSEPPSLPRWPLSRRSDDGSTPVAFEVSEVARGTAAEPLHAPAPLAMHWPAGDVARVPFELDGSELKLMVTIGGRSVWAMLDSGANVTSIDATRPLAALVKPAVEVKGAGATETISLGLGSLEDLDVGGLRIPKLVTATTPMPVLDLLGNRRAEIVLGFSFFTDAAIRVDFAHGEITLAKDPAKVVPTGATKIPIGVVAKNVVVDATIDGIPCTFLVDTGNQGAFDLYEAWAGTHAFPGDRTTATVDELGGAGTTTAKHVLFRARRAELGPLVVEDFVSDVTGSNPSKVVGGLLGNAALARCRSVTFDVPRRALYLETPCDRPVAEGKAHFGLRRTPDAAHPKTPWVISSVQANGSAARAGLKPGDRLLSIDGKPASEDGAYRIAFEGPVGTHVRMKVLRSGKPMEIDLVLVRSP